MLLIVNNDDLNENVTPTFLVLSPSISGVLGDGDQSMLGEMQIARFKAFI